MTEAECNNILSKLKKEQSGFGDALRTIRTKQNISLYEVASRADKTAPYISDIERGRNKPPKKELLQTLLEILEVQDTELQSYMYDLAAEKRGGVSEDIAGYIMHNSDLRRVIRMAQSQRCGEKFWREFANQVL